MFTATGNNFGVSEIIFQDYQSTTLIVLTSKIVIDTTNTDYLAAETLKIFVPNLTMNKSAMSSAFIVSMQSPVRRGTIVRCWINDKNTICIEKLTDWDSFGSVTIYICNAFVTLAQRRTFTKDGYVAISLLNAPSTVKISSKMAVVKDNYCFIAIWFSLFYITSSNTSFSFQINGVPDDIDVEFPIVIREGTIHTKGQALAICTLKGNTLTCEGLPQTLANGNDGRVMMIFCPRNIGTT